MKYVPVLFVFILCFAFLLIACSTQEQGSLQPSSSATSPVQSPQPFAELPLSNQSIQTGQIAQQNTTRNILPADMRNTDGLAEAATDLDLVN